MKIFKRIFDAHLVTKNIVKAELYFLSFHFGLQNPTAFLVSDATI